MSFDAGKSRFGSCYQTDEESFSGIIRFEKSLGAAAIETVLLLLFTVACLLLFSCNAAAETGSFLKMEPSGHMDLLYAEQFSVDYYEGDYALITVAGTDEFLLVPEGKPVPEDLPQDIAVLKQPLASIYVGSSSAMDLFLHAGALDNVTMTSTSAGNWTIPEIRDKVEEGSIMYIGKYSAPDYETLLAEGCGLAVENTMIYHCPETKEMIEQLGIPVLVERSSYESHPLGRVEWIRLYGLLAGNTDIADGFFAESTEQLEAVEGQEQTGKTAAFFYITSSGYVNIRKPGDYIAKMISLAGGKYVFSDLEDDSENALSTMNMDFETFYAEALDADILIYNSTVETEISTMDELLLKNPLLADFKAVKDGNVWCTNQNMFQQVSGAADMITDLHTILSGGNEMLTYLHKVRHCT